MMESRTKLPKGLEFLGCLNVTLVLRDFQVLTGKIKGIIGEDDKPDKFDKPEDQHKPDHFIDDKCGKPHPPKIDVKVEVEEENKFILLELTRPAAAVNLSSFLCQLPTAIDLVLSGTTFLAGECVAVNVENILYAGTAPEFCDIPISIGTDAAGALTFSLKK